jgi:hypothetical protein
MKICNATLKSATPYSQSKIPQVPKLEKETADAFEQRTWREKMHANADGEVYIPAMAFKQAIDKAASMLGIQIPGRGKSTYTKHFLAGCIVEADVALTAEGDPIMKDQVSPERIYANADGKRGSGKRVWRIFPTIPKWEGTARFVIFDDAITKEVFERHLIEAGRYVGVGRFRAENGGLYGRFQVEKVKWE